MNPLQRLAQDLTVVRYLVGGCIALVMVVLLTVVGISFYRGITGPEVVGLLSFVGVLIGLLGSLIGNQAATSQVVAVKEQVVEVKDKVNGHVDAHGQTDQQIEGIVNQWLADHGDQWLADHGVTVRPPPEPPPAGGGGSTC